MIPCNVGKTPCSIRQFDGDLFIAMADPPGIYAYDEELEKFKPCTKVSMPGPLRGFIKTGDLFYATVGEYLFKISDNEQIFIADIRHLTGLKSAIHVSLAVKENSDGRSLFLSDVIQGGLHFFKIE